MRIFLGAGRSLQKRPQPITSLATSQPLLTIGSWRLPPHESSSQQVCEILQTLLRPALVVFRQRPPLFTLPYLQIPPSMVMRPWRTRSGTPDEPAGVCSAHIAKREQAKMPGRGGRKVRRRGGCQQPAEDEETIPSKVADPKEGGEMYTRKERRAWCAKGGRNRHIYSTNLQARAEHIITGVKIKKNKAGRRGEEGRTA